MNKLFVAYGPGFSGGYDNQEVAEEVVRKHKCGEVYISLRWAREQIQILELQANPGQHVTDLIDKLTAAPRNVG